MGAEPLRLSAEGIDAFLAATIEDDAFAELVPGWPALTGLVARRARREPAWASLNWITAGDVRRFARRHGLSLQRQAGQLTAAIERLRADDAFARRQRGPVAVVVGMLDRLGLTGLLGRLPAAFATPMTFTLSKPA